jgi:hypothetical protein
VSHCVYGHTCSRIYFFPYLHRAHIAAEYNYKKLLDLLPQLPSSLKCELDHDFLITDVSGSEMGACRDMQMNVLLCMYHCPLFLLQSPLHTAVKYRQYQAVQSLLRAGANPLKDSSIIILEEACCNGYIDDVKALLKHMVKDDIRYAG